MCVHQHGARLVVRRRAGYACQMTYCVGVLLQQGIIFASDSRTNAGLDNVSKFCKMTVFERPGDRVIVLLSSGNLAGTQAVISILRQRGEVNEGKCTLWSARTMFDAVTCVSEAVRAVGSRDAKYLEATEVSFNASFIIGGQIAGESMRLFRTYAEGNFIEVGEHIPYLQTGEAKYGKPILDRVITPSVSLADATKCILVSFDSTMRSNMSVDMPIDLLCYERDALRVSMRRRLEHHDAYFDELSKAWSEGTREVFRKLPVLRW